MSKYTIKDFEDFYREDNLDAIWDLFVELGICSEETLSVVTAINGYNDETFEDILYATSGLRSLEQLVDDTGIDPYDYGLVDEDEDEEDEEEY